MDYIFTSNVLPEDVFFTRVLPLFASWLSTDSRVTPSSTPDGMGFPIALRSRQPFQESVQVLTDPRIGKAALVLQACKKGLEIIIFHILEC